MMTNQNHRLGRYSYDRSAPFTFQIGIGQVIMGWEKGLLGVCVGEKRKLVVPPHLGYGDVSWISSIMYD